MNFLLLFLSLGSTGIDDYIVSVGDKLLVSVYGGVSFSYQQVVTSRGEIFIQYVSSPPDEDAPFIAWEVLDVVNVAGIDLKTVTKIVEDRFSKYFRDVRVNLSVVSFSARIYIRGAVGHPGTYPFLPGKSIREYIEGAGGLRPSADLSLIRVTKFDSIIETTQESIVEEDWSIYIPHSYVYIKGMVIEPGARAYNPDLSGLDYIGLSGGPSERANMKKAYILTREGEKLPITDSPPRYSAVMVPEIGIMWWQDYLTIVSAVTGIIITWLTITR